MDPLVHTRPRNSQNSGLHAANLLRRRRRLSQCPERWWPPFLGIHKVWSTSTTWRRAKRSQGCTMPNYWADSPPNYRKHGPFGEEKSDFPSWQRNGSHFRPRQGQIGRIGLRTATPSTIFSRFGPVWLLIVSKLEKVTRWKFASNEVVVAAKEAYFTDLEKSDFSDGLKKLEHRWVKCIEVKEDYVEK